MGYDGTLGTTVRRRTGPTAIAYFRNDGNKSSPLFKHLSPGPGTPFYPNTSSPFGPGTIQGTTFASGGGYGGYGAGSASPACFDMDGGGP